MSNLAQVARQLNESMTTGQAIELVRMWGTKNCPGQGLLETAEAMNLEFQRGQLTLKEAVAFDIFFDEMAALFA